MEKHLNVLFSRMPKIVAYNDLAKPLGRQGPFSQYAINSLKLL